jgi:hypothetical protein
MKHVKSVFSDIIPKNSTIVAIYSDGSGANLFHIDGERCLYNSDMDNMDYAPNHYLQEAGYLWWVKLPKWFQLWGNRP